ncbi:MAG: tRNA (N6-threonylcarbamoyladenosine(37)-N6)-methyltransferase TrmO [Polyangiaceae bacterium]
MTAPIELTPIGRIRTPFREKAEAPRQATVAADVPGRIELSPGRGFEDAVSDLELWPRIWVIFLFHLNLRGPDAGYRPKVQPPRSDVKRGVFATRSPHRPNPIGMSVVRLVKVRGLVIDVLDVDMVDDTPVLDLKPYVAYADAFPDAESGWLDPGEPSREPGAASPRDPRAAFDVDFDPLATAQLAWLTERGVDLDARLKSALALGPEPHAYRRIKDMGAGLSRIAVKAWRADFRVEGRLIRVVRVASGHRPRDLAEGTADDLDLHRAFVATFG